MKVARVAKEVLTYSKRRDFQNCPRYFFHRHVEHKRIRAEKPGRRKGAAFGKALETMRVLKGDPLAQQEAAEVSLAESYSELHPSDQDESDELEFEKHALLVLAIGYAEHYGLQERREIEYLLPLVNPTTGRRSRLYDIAGKIDGLELIGHKSEESLVWPVYRLIEDKLVQQIQKPMIDRLPLDQQTSEYLDAIVAKVGTVEIEVSYRFTRWPSIRRRQAESLDGFCSRFTSDMEDRPDFYFVEQRVFFPTEQLEDFRRARWGLSQQIRRATREHACTPDRDRLFPQNPSKCWEYGGCEFIPLCTKRWGADDLYVTTTENEELTIDKEATDGHDASAG